MTGFIGFEVMALVIGTFIIGIKENEKSVARLLGLYIAVIIPVVIVWVAMMGESVISIMKGTGVI